MKLPYFKLKDAFNEVRINFSYGSGTEKLVSTAKLFGKSVANVGMLTTELGVEIVSALAKKGKEERERREEQELHEELLKEREEREEREVQERRETRKRDLAKKLGLEEEEKE
jgi:hypothetical protein